MTHIPATILLAIVLTAGQQPPSQPRDAVGPTGTAVVRGRVIAAATGLPLHRVHVTLNGGLPNAPAGVTDTRGEFEIRDVPTGTYTLTATRAGYLSQQYGQRRPREAGRRIEVAAGAVIEKIDFALSRGGAIAGRVTDDQGDAAPGVRVEALELRYIRGRRVPVPAKIVTTNDAGEFRASGLEPGTYQVRATSQEMWESDDGKQSLVYVPTLYPGVATTDQAQRLAVALGQEIGGLEFRLLAGRAARLTGVVEDAQGAPVKSQIVNLDTIMRTIGGDLLGAGFGGNARTNDRGAFEFPPLAPGEYMVYTGASAERAAVQVIVNESETRHVVLSPRAPSVVSGTIVTDEGSPPPFAASRLRIVPVSADPDMQLAPWNAPREQQARPDWTFRFTDVKGPYLFRVAGLPDGWMLKSVMLGGSDVIDAPLNVTPGAGDTQGVQLVLSRAGAKVTGTVVDREGAPNPDVTIVLFAENRALWGIGSRFVHATRPDDRGQFTFHGVPPGVYRAIAREVVVSGQWEDPEFLQTLLRDAVRVELAPSANEPLTLTIPMESR